MQHFAWYVEISCALTQSAQAMLLNMECAQHMQNKVVFLDWLWSLLNNHQLYVISMWTTDADLAQSPSSVCWWFTVHIGQFHTVSHLCCSVLNSCWSQFLCSKWPWFCFCKCPVELSDHCLHNKIVLQYNWGHLRCWFELFVGWLFSSSAEYAGIGIFLLMRTTQVLLMRGNRVCTVPSIYLDQHGEASFFTNSLLP
jgi:hypothetical protein